MSLLLIFWVNWSFHLLCLPIYSGKRRLSLSLMVINPSRSFVWLWVLFLVHLCVLIFPLIGWISPVCDPRCPSIFGCYGVLPVRVSKQPWPPPVFFFFGELSGTRWCVMIVLIRINNDMMMRSGWVIISMDEGMIQGNREV